ncbi:SARP family transcriptional regulator [Sphaerisporangium melleum]|uniref:SARP family transcriptional regulator n=1 Tax=Sphaerisporangium melleum TaxID=321316 RepID=A0A917QSJ8_9ACTN|nr:BTAD domain-containing putative transcriptional regulator [Sphaerisporangium melleum]GGK66411.1 SARP family transcriptional regulator [Sphaerisporangium melleum]GII68608.1 SARP family transcriptional regulator [Sphaerisporangium melleum]
MEFQVLGPLTVTREGRPVPIGTAYKPRLLLAVLLAAESGRVVPTEWLIDALWADGPPPSARRNIQLYVHRLRGALGPDRIIRTPDGYRIVTGDGLDSARFRRLSAEGRRAMDRDDPPPAARLLRQALDLWRGPAFAEFSECEGVTGEAEQLEQLRLVTHERWAEAELRLGRHHELIPVLTRLVREAPYREGLRAHLMTALDRGGRQAEALELFRRTRTLLREQLGIEPGPALQRVHEAILRGGDGTAPAQPTRLAPPLRSPARPEPAAVTSTPFAALPAPRELPSDVAGFTGRQDALDALDALLREGSGANRIIAITGTGGVGKTALAVRWAHRAAARFPDGQLYLNLRGYSAATPVRPMDALAGFLRALGMPPEQVPLDVAEAAARYRSLTAGRRVLVLLDNADSAEQVRPLIPGHSGCLVLVTSRDRLTGLVAREGARRVPLDVLAPDEATALIGHLVGTGRVAAEPAAVARLARVCGHLPLALRIAAAHLLDRPRQPIEEYVAELGAGNPVTALTVEGDEETAVHTAFDLSYRTLPGPVRAMFRRLGLVACPDLTPAAAAVLAGVPEPEAAAALDRLAGIHLVEQHKPGRFALHDLLRRYAADLSAAEDPPEDRRAAVDRLLTWYLSTIDGAARALYPDMLLLPAPEGVLANPVPAPPAPAAMAWLEAERHNVNAAVRHALRHGFRPLAWLMADRIRGYHNLSRNMVDWIATARTALTAARFEGDRRAMASAFLNLAHVNYCLARYARSIAYLGRAITLCAETGWAEGEASALSNLGTTLMFVGRPEEATGHLHKALRLHDRLGSRQGRAKVVNNLANACRQSGRLREGLVWAEQALALIRENDRAPRAEAVAIATLGELHHVLGDLTAAAGHLTTALARHQELGDRYLEANSLAWLALVHRDAGRPEQAREVAEEALSLATDIGDRYTEVQALNTLASLRARAGDPAEALRLHGRALATAEEINSPGQVIEASIGLSDAYQHAGEHVTAVDFAEQAVKQASTSGFLVLEGQALTALARAQHGLGRLAEAAAHGRRALDVHRRTGHRIGEARTLALLALIARDGGDSSTGRRLERLSADLYAAAGASPPPARAPHLELSDSTGTSPPADGELPDPTG